MLLSMLKPKAKNPSPSLVSVIVSFHRRTSQSSSFGLLRYIVYLFTVLRSCRLWSVAFYSSVVDRCLQDSKPGPISDPTKGILLTNKPSSHSKPQPGFPYVGNRPHFTILRQNPEFFDHGKEIKKLVLIGNRLEKPLKRFCCSTTTFGW